MVWAAETSCGYESAKIASIAVPYLQGVGLDIGAGMSPVWPSAIAIDNGHHFGERSAGIRGDGADLAMFADESLDYVFSSHTLEHFQRAKVPAILAEWSRVLKVGGHLVLYLPSANLYPRCGEEGANPDHKWDILPRDVEDILEQQTIGAEAAHGWELLESEERNGTNEYSLFIVARKTIEGWTENVWRRNPGGLKRALVIRYGAIGDQIVAASVLPLLRKQNYHVTYNTTPDAQQVVLHDPHVDEWLIQAKDFVPNVQLGPYWASIAERYDRVVNLCESIEGALLQLPGRLQHRYSDEARRRMFGTVNYLERTHDIAGVPHRFGARFYPTPFESRWANAVRGGMSGPVVAWAVAGSSLHKIYPWTDIVTAWLLKNTPVHVVLMGDKDQGAALSKAISDNLGDVDRGRLHLMAGMWSIRQSMSFVQAADVVVGPETGLLNGVCMEMNAKVVYLSHSSRENLTKHWVNTTVLEPDHERAPCWPCHRLHYDWSHCHLNPTTNAAACASAVAPEHLFEAIVESMRSAGRAQIVAAE